MADFLIKQARKSSKETLEKIKAKDVRYTKLEGVKDGSDKLAQVKTLEVQQLKKDLMVVRREQVSFQWNNPDFILKNPDFLLKNG